MRSLLLMLALAAPVAAQMPPPGGDPVPPVPAPVVELDAKAVVTLDNGEPIGDTWPAGINMPLSYAKSVVGERGLKSIRVIVKPDWLQKYMRVHPETKSIDLPVGTGQKTITIVLKVAYRDTFDEITVPVRIVANPDDPTPNPTPPGPTPDPTPGPPAPPAPTPVPVVTGHIFASYIVDASAVTPAAAALKRPATVDEAFKGLDASWRWYQSDESALVTNNLISYAKAAGMPCLLIQSPDGRIVKTIKAPTEADAVAAVKALRGSN